MINYEEKQIPQVILRLLSLDRIDNWKIDYCRGGKNPRESERRKIKANPTHIVGVDLGEPSVLVAMPYVPTLINLKLKISARKDFQNVALRVTMF